MMSLIMFPQITVGFVLLSFWITIWHYKSACISGTHFSKWRPFL